MWTSSSKLPCSSPALPLAMSSSSTMEMRMLAMSCEFVCWPEYERTLRGVTDDLWLPNDCAEEIEFREELEMVEAEQEV